MLGSKGTLIPKHQSVVRLYNASGNGKDDFLSSFIFLLASYFSFVLNLARYAFELTTNHMLNNPMKNVQDIMTYLGSRLQQFMTIDDEQTMVSLFYTATLKIVGRQCLR